MELYTLDRSGSCTIGSSLILQPPLYDSDHFHGQDLETSSEIVDTLRWLVADGLTSHGRRHLMEPFNLNQGFVQANPIVDLVFELIRIHGYPDKPSRYQSVFGATTADGIRQFRSEFGQPHQRIFKVECQKYFEADMRLVSLGASAASAINLARKYWSGQSSVNPLWEVLMVPPVLVLEQIDPTA